MAQNLNIEVLTAWDGSVSNKDAEVLAQQLDLPIDHIVEGRTSEDILYEILLKSGFPLSIEITTLTLEDKVVYSIAGGAMLICLDRNPTNITKLTNEVLKVLADRQPQRVVCLDEGFAGNDQIKTNAVQMMKARGVTSFRMVKA